VVTDFGVHPFWIADGTDQYIAGCSKTKESLISAGVPEDSILEFGIPVEEEFSQSYDKARVCAKLGISKDKFTVLLMTGSFGLGPLEKLSEMLHKHVQVLVVCARNKKLLKRLSQRKLSDVTAFGFADNIAELMAVSDLIITKAGGSTLSEFLNMGLVPLFISVIPGQEEANVKLLASYGIGCVPKDLRQLKNLVIEFYNHPDKLSEIKEKIAVLKKPFTSKDICNVVCQNSCRPAG
jgi:processive 1,2-diacylglycerol beta-glucosyltransferase